MPKPNYAFARRQRDMAKRLKKEEKRQRKAEGQPPTTQDGLPQPPEGETTGA